ncbi:hypothetical protein [Catenuloplanes indicus]|uniref:Uncharacterized protein n=1 Tax=Catenuloplanes indicus TaxID=137267 RepID=A0AAE3W479_9ACTN|nr:hypothetical protein [Catenuloplanes indicus]MDQ0368975.1 hypothetical protein [Catenuloplanes indicus]
MRRRTLLTAAAATPLAAVLPAAAFPGSAHAADTAPTGFAALGTGTTGGAGPPSPRRTRTSSWRTSTPPAR